MAGTMMLSYRYRLFPPLDWDAVCETEMRLQKRLWNRLVAVEHAYRADLDAALRAAHPAYAAASDAAATIGGEMDRLVAERKAARKAARGNVATPDLDATIGALGERRRAAWTALTAARREAFRLAAEAVAALRDRRYGQITEARQQSGLWWGNYNAVVASFDATLRRIQPWQEPRAQEEDDDTSGRLTVQLQNGCPVPAFLRAARSEAAIVDGHLTATVRSAGPGNRKTVTWRLVPHRFRPLPESGIIKSLTVTRRRPRPGTGPRAYEWHAVLNIEVPEAAPALQALVAGIDIGWRLLGDHGAEGMRVATIADGATIEHVILPGTWLRARFEAAEEAGMLRTEAREIALPPGIAEDLRERVASLADALQALPKERRGGGREWLDRYKNLRAHIARLERLRRELYHRAAAALVRKYGVIAIDAGGIADMARDRSMPPPVRRSRTWAAPHELATAIKNAARREGVEMRPMTGATTLCCHRCGHRNNPPENWRADLVWRCEKCRGIWDQDENAALNCRAAALDASALAAMAPIAAKPARKKPPRMTRKGERSKTAAQVIDAAADGE